MKNKIQNHTLVDIIIIIAIVLLVVWAVSQIHHCNQKLPKQNAQKAELLRLCINDVEEVFVAVEQQTGATRFEIFGGDSVARFRRAVSNWEKSNRSPSIKHQEFDSIFFAVRQEMRYAMQAFQTIAGRRATKAEFLLVLKKRYEIMEPDGWVEWSTHKHHLLDAIQAGKSLNFATNSQHKTL